MSEKILRVDMGEKEVNFEEVPEDYSNLGGRGLTSSIVFDEVPPNCNPLGSKNKLVFAPGIVTGSNAPSSGRISVGGKSPLTGGIKESNAGTRFSQTLARLGYKAIIIEGKNNEDYSLLKVNEGNAELLPADDLSGIGLYEAFERLRKNFGENIDISGAGIVAERGGANSGVAFNDPEGRSTRYSGRGGLGSVMCSRGLKFILLDRENAEEKKASQKFGIRVKNEEKFKQGRKKLLNSLHEHDVTKPNGALNTYGTTVLINILNEAGGLPQRNFSSGRDDNSAKVSGEEKVEMIKERGGEKPHGCHPGCAINCSEIWTKEDGSDPVGVLEYESVWALGPNCGIYDLDTIGELNRACNDLGLDTIEAGATIAVAMESGIADFGDGERALELMEEIRKGTPLGRILMNGAEFTGQAFNVDRIPVVKGQAMPAYDPRAVKGIGVTYATSTMGADHTAGYAVAPEILSVGGESDPLSNEGKIDLSRDFQKTTAFIDSSGYCLFIAFAILDIENGFEGMIETVNGVQGTDWNADDVVNIGAEILKKERKFNEKAGITKSDDKIPEFMREEELPPHDAVFDISDEELNKVFEEF